MTEVLQADRYSPIEWVDTPVEVDWRYIEDTPVIANKTGQAICSPMMENKLETLFEVTPPLAWATFSPSPGYITRLRYLFLRKVLSSFDPECSIDMLDAFFENGDEEEDEDAERESIYAMLHSLKSLNTLSEEIFLRIL